MAGSRGGLPLALLLVFAAARRTSNVAFAPPAEAAAAVIGGAEGLGEAPIVLGCVRVVKRRRPAEGGLERDLLNW